jgi:hypothetical protein
MAFETFRKAALTAVIKGATTNGENKYGHAQSMP